MHMGGVTRAREVAVGEALGASKSVGTFLVDIRGLGAIRDRRAACAVTRSGDDGDGIYGSMLRVSCARVAKGRCAIR